MAMAPTHALTQSPIHDRPSLLTVGKVREIHSLDDSSLLFVATDRISAYDVVMKNAVPNKGAVLTLLSKFWFDLLRAEIPHLQTHFISLGIPDSLCSHLSVQDATSLGCRSMVVKRLKVFPIESIVRGYITGSAWSSYKKDGTVNGIQIPAGLKESQKFPQPLWTPSTKAEAGGKDENISPEEAARMIGSEYASQIEKLSLLCYEKANAYAASRGIILADTKFEFALDQSTTPPSVVLVDEVLTPDSSRFWPADKYETGRSQESYDKQYLRDWLVETGQKGKQGVEMPADIVENTEGRYREAYEALVGRSFDQAMAA